MTLTEIKKLIGNVQEEIRIFERPSSDNVKLMLIALKDLIEITDADIEAWAETLDIQDLDVELTQHELTERKIGAVMGARAVLNNEIKHNQ